MHITLWTHWDHVSGYWKTSLENPDKVLFLTYEDMKTDPVVCLTKLAKFLDKPFCLEEEWEEVVQKIVRLCSFENLSSLEVNQIAVQHFSPQLAVENRHFLRKGQVGDCANYMTLEMAQQLD
ncbi:Flavonol 4'-sulfotransferase [Capsicum annuum]|nr:Flavonol 4'-sulfotransferase [Capsicum annuum]